MTDFIWTLMGAVIVAPLGMFLCNLVHKYIHKDKKHE